MRWWEWAIVGGVFVVHFVLNRCQFGQLIFNTQESLRGGARALGVAVAEMQDRIEAVEERLKEMEARLN